MESNMRKGVYHDFAAFQADVYQIVINAQTFNPKGDLVHHIASEFKRQYDTVVFPRCLQEYHTKVAKERNRLFSKAEKERVKFERQQRALAGKMMRHS